MAVAVTSDVQMQFSGSAGAWTSVLADLRSDVSVAAAYGIQGNGPEDHVAGPGTLSFALNNAQNNSGAKLGYYSPGHANARSGFELGIGVRLAFTYSGSTFYKFRGTLDEIDPVPGQYRGRMTRCVAVDWMDEAANQKINNVATQTGQRADQLIGTIVGTLARRPAASALGVAGTAYPYALDTAKDETTTALGELARAVQSDLGYLYVVGDQTTGGVLTYHDRRYRLNSACAVASASLSASSRTSTNDFIDMALARKRQYVYNRVKVTVHPRRVGSTTDVLYALDTGNPPIIAAGATLQIIGQYRDPNQQAQRVGGTAMIAPVATTDYAFGTSASDTSLTACLTVTACYGGNGVLYTLTNNSAQSGYVSRLQARGTGLYDYAPVTVSASSASSIAAYGEHVLTFDLPHESGTDTAQAIAEYYLSRYEPPSYSVDRVTFTANESDANMRAMLFREPGDVVVLSESMTGFASAPYFINGVEITIKPRNIVECAWTVAPKLDTTDYFILENTTRGKLDGAYGLAPM